MIKRIGGVQKKSWQNSGKKSDVKTPCFKKKKSLGVPKKKKEPQAKEKKKKGLKRKRKKSINNQNDWWAKE